MQMGAVSVFVGSGIFKSEDPAVRAKSIVQAVTYYKDPKKLAEISRDLGEAMRGLDVAGMPDEERLAKRGW
jgi:pyridoxal 5'-phosphate synthase pdxS subunit